MKCFSVSRLTLSPRTKTGGLQRRQNKRAITARGVFTQSLLGSTKTCKTRGRVG